MVLDIRPICGQYTVSMECVGWKTAWERSRSGTIFKISQHAGRWMPLSSALLRATFESSSQPDAMSWSALTISGPNYTKQTCLNKNRSFVTDVMRPLILLSVLRQVRSVFRSQFSTQCDLVLPLSVCGTLSFPKGHPVAAHALFLLPITSILPSLFPSITCFRRQFQHKMWPIQLAFLFLPFAGYSSSPCLFVILLHFSHGRSNWSSLSFLNTTFQNFPGISDLLSEMFRFQHHIQLYPTCSTLLVSSLNLSPICWWKESPYCWKLLLLW